MKYLIKIICVLAIYLPFQYYYEGKYHHRMDFGTGFLVALVAFGVAAGIEYMIKGNKQQNNNQQNNQGNNPDDGQPM